MPNGGSDCCGTCWFNRTNQGQRDWLKHADKSVPPYCEIRDLAIENAFYTYCANHPHRRPDRDPVPIGPVTCHGGWEDMGFSEHPRVVWKPSPDSEEIRQHLLDLLESISEHIDNDRYPLGIGLGETIIWQLGEFRERRAIAGLERICEDGLEELADAASEGLTKIRNPVEMLKKAVLPDASPEPGVELFVRMIAQGRSAPDKLYRPVRLSRVLNGTMATKTRGYWQDHVGKTVDIPFSSYTGDLKLAERLISLGEPVEQMMFIISNNKRAFRIGALSKTSDEDEWISGGRFKVSSVHSEQIEDASIRRTNVEIEQTAVFGLWGVDVPRTDSKSGQEGTSAVQEFDMVLVKKFDETPYLLGGPFDRSGNTLFDE